MHGVYTNAGKAEQACLALGRRGAEVCGCSEVLSSSHGEGPAPEKALASDHTGLTPAWTQSGGEYVNAQSSVTLQSYGKSICAPHQDHSMSQGCAQRNPDVTPWGASAENRGLK